jgi:hypothetical protein
MKNDLTDIRNSVKKIELFCKKENLPFKKPLLILGIFERVGSNWLLDTLNSCVHTHNEPFKQQLGKESAYSTLATHLEDVQSPLSLQKNPFIRYWLETFVATKYGTVDHAIKETNLFFALKNFTILFSDAPVLVLKREPLGIFSSLMSQDLFSQWHYVQRYEQLHAVALSPEWKAFQFIFDSPNGSAVSPMQILTRLLFLNTLLIAEALDARPYVEVSYEASVKNHSEILAFLSVEVFPGRDFLSAQEETLDVSNTRQGTFSPGRTKNTLKAFLDTQDEKVVYAELDRLLAAAEMHFSARSIERTKNFLHYNRRSYDLVGRKPASVFPSLAEHKTAAAPIAFVPDETNPIAWRNILVTNREYAEFLNALRSKNIFNVLDGGQMFFNENMIEARGGRIHFNTIHNVYEVSAGYEEHPVYWVTWIGALAFAHYRGLRLPTRAELCSLIEHTPVVFDAINAGHVHDDVQPVSLERYVHGAICDVVGNLSVWCSDGPDQKEGDPQSVTKYIYGTAWNRPATTQEMTKGNSRPIVGNSRSVGIRLVQDASTQPMSFEKLVAQIQKIPNILKEHTDKSLRFKDQAIIDLLQA